MQKGQTKEQDQLTRLAIQIAQQMHPLLAGYPPEVQGAALADLLATWLAGHQGPDAEQLREELLAQHIEAVRQLVPVNEKMILDQMKGRAR